MRLSFIEETQGKGWNQNIEIIGIFEYGVGREECAFACVRANKPEIKHCFPRKALWNRNKLLKGHKEYENIHQMPQRKKKYYEKDKFVIRLLLILNLEMKSSTSIKWIFD